MRLLLASVMLLLMIIFVYNATIGGESGARAVVEERGSRLQDEIGGMEP